MRVSAKSEYACRAMLELSRCYPQTEVVQINDIAIRQGIPRKYLVQILLQLQRAGLVKSRRGATGGYMLAKPPGEITLGDVVRTTDGILISVESLETRSNTKANPAVRVSQQVLKEVWQDVHRQLSVVMDGITFEEICRRADRHASMYYI
jgi:Rrf2 family protein